MHISKVLMRYGFKLTYTQNLSVQDMEEEIYFTLLSIFLEI